MNHYSRIVLIVFLGVFIYIAILAIPNFGKTVYAKSYSSKLSEIRNRKKNIESDIRKLKNDKGALSTEMKNLDNELLTAEDELSATKTNLKTQETEKERLQKELDEKNLDLDNKRVQLGERSVELYKQGDLSYLDLVFGAEDFGDFINRVFFLQIIYENDQSLIDSVKNGIAEVTLKQVAVNQKINEIKDLKAEIEARIEEITELKDTKKRAMSVLDQDIAIYEKSVKELEEESRRIQRELANMQKQGGSYKGKPWTSRFLKPVDGPIVSGFGYRIHPIYKRKKFHMGVDISASYGKPIKAGGDGKVVFADWRGGYGKCVIIDHGKGVSTLYGHMSSISVANGDVVKAGSIIGKIGSTGLSTGPHLHFEVRINGEPVDPLGKL